MQVAYVSKPSSSNFVGFYILSFALANLALRRSLTLTYSVASTATPESGGRSMLSKVANSCLDRRSRAFLLVQRDGGHEGPADKQKQA